jgi:hypothetical protein
MTSSDNFDVYSVSDQVVQEMLKEKQNNPDLIISYSFLEYYSHQEIIDLIQSAYQYGKLLISINSTYISLKQEGKIRQAQMFSDKQSLLLPEAGKKVALKYGKVLLKYKTLVSSLEDQNFFETIIYFTVRVVKTRFSPDQGRGLEEELNRLFRTTAFNIAHRKNAEAEKILKFPQLKNSPKRDSESVINGIILRNWANRENLQHFHSVETVKRPAYSKISPFKAISSRSPLISMILPSPKDKIREVEDYRRRAVARSQRLPFVYG